MKFDAVYCYLFSIILKAFFAVLILASALISGFQIQLRKMVSFILITLNHSSHIHGIHAFFNMWILFMKGYRVVWLVDSFVPHHYI